MKQHTAEPWKAERTGDRKRYLVTGKEGYCVAEVDSDDIDRDEAAANCALILAAPDLLAICREMLDALDGSTAQVMATAGRMRAVVARAQPPTEPRT